MKISPKNTEVLISSRDNNIRKKIKLKGDKTIDQIEDFIYLGSTMS